MEHYVCLICDRSFCRWALGALAESPSQRTCLASYQHRDALNPIQWSSFKKKEGSSLIDEVTGRKCSEMSESKEQGGAPPEGPGDHVSLSAYQDDRRMQFWSLKAPAGNDVLWKPQDNDLGPVLFWVATCRWHGIRWCVTEFCWQTKNKIKTKKNLIAWVRGRLLARGHARDVLSFEPEPRNGEHRAQTSQPVSPGRTAESWHTTVAGLSFFPFKVASEKSNSEPHAFKVALCQLNHHSTLPLSF